MYRVGQLSIIDKFMLEQKVGIDFYGMLNHNEVSLIFDSTFGERK